MDSTSVLTSFRRCGFCRNVAIPSGPSVDSMRNVVMPARYRTVRRARARPGLARDEAANSARRASDPPVRAMVGAHGNALPRHHHHGRPRTTPWAWHGGRSNNDRPPAPRCRGRSHRSTGGRGASRRTEEWRCVFKTSAACSPAADDVSARRAQLRRPRDRRRRHRRRGRRLPGVDRRPRPRHRDNRRPRRSSTPTRRERVRSSRRGGAHRNSDRRTFPIEFRGSESTKRTRRGRL